MTNRKMFFTMLWGAVFRRRSRAMMAVIASLVGAATLFCLASVCVAVPQQMNEEMRAYGANLIVTPASATGKSQGIDTATVRNVTALVGAGVGAAIAGAKPVIDLHFADFIGIAMDEVLNQMAKAHYMFGGQATMSLVLRAPDGLMKHGAAQHSQSLETWFTNIPGIRVVVPSTPANGKQLLKAAIKDPNPVIYFENKGLFPVKGDVPEDLPPIDLSRAEVVREGADVTLVSYGLMLTKALAAADVARREYGVSVEVIDLRSITPLDMPTIYASVKKTGHLVIAHEAIKIGGVGGEIAARVAENHFDYLRGPVLRVGARFTPLPFSPVMEDFVLSGEKEILDAVLAAAGKSAVDGADGAAGRAGEAA